MRRELEAAVVELRGEISLSDAAVIQTATRYERHAALASKWLRENPDLPIETRLNISRDIAKASGERDKCIKLLGLGARHHDPLALLRQQFGIARPATPTPPLEVPDAGNPPSASDRAGASPGKEPESEAHWDSMTDLELGEHDA